MSRLHDTALWDEERLRTVMDALSAHAHYWAEQIGECDLPNDLEDALAAMRELRSCLGAMRDFRP